MSSSQETTSPVGMAPTETRSMSTETKDDVLGYLDPFTTGVIIGAAIGTGVLVSIAVDKTVNNQNVGQQAYDQAKKAQQQANSSQNVMH